MDARRDTAGSDVGCWLGVIDIDHPAALVVQGVFDDASKVGEVELF